MDQNLVHYCSKYMWPACEIQKKEHFEKVIPSLGVLLPRSKWVYWAPPKSQHFPLSWGKIDSNSCDVWTAESSFECCCEGLLGCPTWGPAKMGSLCWSPRKKIVFYELRCVPLLQVLYLSGALQGKVGQFRLANIQLQSWGTLFRSYQISFPLQYTSHGIVTMTWQYQVPKPMKLYHMNLKVKTYYMQ